MKTYLIGEIASMMNFNTSALRFYERIGLLPPAARINGRRVYDERMLKRLAVVEAMKGVGFTIAEIQTLSSAWEREGKLPKSWRSFVERKVGEMDTQMAKLTKMRTMLVTALECTCWDELEGSFESYIDGFDLSAYGKERPEYRADLGRARKAKGRSRAKPARS